MYPPAATGSAGIRFGIADWSAWAPGLDAAQLWQQWAQAPSLPAGSERPELPQVAPLLRRRAERLARMAMHTAAELRQTRACPMVFASARGEAARALPLLQELATSNRVAPGPFSLSVHNAVAALDSIAHHDRGFCTALAAGAESAEVALVEAAALLADGHDEVIVTVYDEVAPDCYREYLDEPDAAYAWSWRVVAAPPGRGFELDWHASHSAAAPYPSPLPAALAVLQFFLTDAPTWTHDGTHRCWTWRRAA